jgi:probable F420-dependent oxidoreductase
MTQLHGASDTIAGMDYGLALPNFPDGASPEGIEAAAEVAQRLGWSTVWTTDHVLVNEAAASEYGRIYEAILTLAWVGAKYPGLRLGTSVIVVPQRNAVLLAKELATLDSLSGGRVIAGVGVGWSREEFANVGVEDRFRVRGAYLDETIRLWRHLWSGSREPFHGRFHTIDDFVFGPLPEREGALPIIVGGRAEAALRRAGGLADGYHSSAASPVSYGERVPVILAAAEAAGRPAPWLSARVRVQFDSTTDRSYAMRGTPEEIAAEARAFAGHGVTHLALYFETTDPAEVVAQAERFAREVAPLIEG